MKNYKRLGDYIRLVDERNTDLAVTQLVGLTINKEFIPSVANTIGSDMANYKIIRKNQFACSLMQVRRDKKIPIALFHQDEPAIISQAYPVFKIIDTNVLLPEYLMMWFSRSEFDREACFYAVGGVRGSLEWDDFCDFTLPIPNIDKQQALIDEYHAIERRIELNEQLCEKLEETAQTLYRKYFVDDIDPENLPEGWRWGTIGEYAKVKSGFAFKSDWWQKKGIPIIKIGSIQNNTIEISDNDYVDNDFLNIAREYKAQFGDVVIAMTGATIGKIALIPKHKNFYLVNQRVGLFNLGNNPIEKMPFLYFVLQQDDVQKEILSVGGSSAQENISATDIENIKISLRHNADIEIFNNKCTTFFQSISKYKYQNQKLKELLSLLLAKMGRK